MSNRMYDRSVFLSAEPLEARRLLSASPLAGLKGAARTEAATALSQPAVKAACQNVQSVSTITFGSAPTAVQTGLSALSPSGVAFDTNQRVVVITTATSVNYSVVLRVPGRRVTLLVDSNGLPVQAKPKYPGPRGAPALSTASTAVQAGLQKLAPAGVTLDPAAPLVTCTKDGLTTYSVTVPPASGFGRGTTLIVDANGLPSGNQVITFGVAPDAVQAGLNALSPSGVAFDPAQPVGVQTRCGKTLFLVKLTGMGSETVLTVNAAGTPIVERGRSSAAFSTLASVVQSGLSTLASTFTIPPTQTVTAVSDGLGTVIYTAKLKATGVTLTVSVDQNGAPVSSKQTACRREEPEDPPGETEDDDAVTEVDNTESGDDDAPVTPPPVTPPPAAAVKPTKPQKPVKTKVVKATTPDHPVVAKKVVAKTFSKVAVAHR